jgi:RNA polymerase sigma-70 factor (ECF subfamily)
MTVGDEEREKHFDALFRQYLPDMVAYCGWRSGSHADAQDAVAETFLAAWRRLDEMPRGTDARLWLYGTARRVLANQARAGRRRERLSARAAEAWEGAAAPFACTSSDLEPAVPAAALADAVHQALACLRPTDREVLLLAEWEGLTPTQIGAVLGCPAVTARGRLFRARRRFKQAFGSMSEQSALPDSATSSTPSTQGVIPCS